MKSEELALSLFNIEVSSSGDGIGRCFTVTSAQEGGGCKGGPPLAIAKGEEKLGSVERGMCVWGDEKGERRLHSLPSK